jgi:nicotinamide mononucleotide transporter PnuC
MINGYLWFSCEVYGHALLDLYYMMTFFVGWQYWSKQNKTFQASTFLRLGFLFAVILLTFLLYVFLRQVSSYLPFLDALNTACALIAQVLTCFRYKEAWILWIIHDGMNFYYAVICGLWFTAFKQFLYFSIAYYGWYRWETEICEPS